MYKIRFMTPKFELIQAMLRQEYSLAARKRYLQELARELARDDDETLHVAARNVINSAIPLYSRDGPMLQATYTIYGGSTIVFKTPRGGVIRLEYKPRAKKKFRLSVTADWFQLSVLLRMLCQLFLLAPHSQVEPYLDGNITVVERSSVPIQEVMQQVCAVLAEPMPQPVV